MVEIVLYQPEIPPNTGNVIRLAANTGARLHLVEPLGFSLQDRRLRRAGLDYRDVAAVHVHPDWAACAQALSGRRMFLLTTHAQTNAFDARFATGDVLLFGSETEGVPDWVRSAFPEEHRLRLPMRRGNRSLNLANAVAIVVYECWRQFRFEGAA
jgi:tRNA (cytidine/uridine-2'-O-)-methyltransferase